MMPILAHPQAAGMRCRESPAQLGDVVLARGLHARGRPDGSVVQGTRRGVRHGIRTFRRCVFTTPLEKRTYDVIRRCVWGAKLKGYFFAHPKSTYDGSGSHAVAHFLTYDLYRRYFDNPRISAGGPRDQNRSLRAARRDPHAQNAGPQGQVWTQPTT